MRNRAGSLCPEMYCKKKMGETPYRATCKNFRPKLVFIWAKKIYEVAALQTFTGRTNTPVGMGLYQKRKNLALTTIDQRKPNQHQTSPTATEGWKRGNFPRVGDGLEFGSNQRPPYLMEGSRSGRHGFGLQLLAPGPSLLLQVEQEVGPD